MSSAYSKDLRELAKTAASNTDISHLIREGVYAMMGGPSFETIAECKMLRMIGADVVGMYLNISYANWPIVNLILVIYYRVGCRGHD